MTSTAVQPLHTDPAGRRDRDRLEILTTLIDAPSFDPLFRPEIIRIPLGHPVYRWDCLVSECGRSRAGHTDLCSAHWDQWHRLDRGGEAAKASFVRAAASVGPGEGVQEVVCRICPERPAGHVGLVLCARHQFRWYRHRHLPGADFDGWLAEQEPAPGYGHCRVLVCPELAHSPLGLCGRHEHRYHAHGSPGGACLPTQ